MAVATTKKPRSTFGHQLLPILKEKRLSRRQLGRMLQPDRPEQGRRSLIRWMYVGEGHHRPSRASRDRVADALGVDRSAFDDDEDDEEADELGRALQSKQVVTLA